MTRHLRKVGAGAAALALGIVLVAGAGNAADDDGKLPISEGDYKKLIAYFGKGIEEGLAGKPDAKKGANKARVLALMLATAGQRGGHGGADALKLAEAIKSGDMDKAKELVKELGGAKGDKGEPVALGKQLEIDELMRQFQPDRAGGLAIEKKLQGWGASKKREIDKKEMNDQLKALAQHLAIIAELTKAHDPGNNQAKWVKYSEDMRKASLDLAQVKTGKEAFKTVNTLYKACNDCHNDFR